jgi:hypothetical protein
MSYPAALRPPQEEQKLTKKNSSEIKVLRLDLTGLLKIPRNKDMLKY